MTMRMIMRKSMNQLWVTAEGGANSNQQCDIRCLCTAIEEETGSASEEKPIYQSP